MNTPYLMVRMFVSNFNEAIVAVIEKQLEKKIKDLIGLTCSVSLYHKEEYWKIPEYTECIFALSGKQIVTTTALREIFGDLQWDCGIVDVKNIETGKKGINDWAIWSKNTTGGTFIDDRVMWVHIYNWDE